MDNINKKEVSEILKSYIETPYVKSENNELTELLNSIKSSEKNISALKNLLSNEYFYTVQEIKEFLPKMIMFDREFLTALLKSTNSNYQNLQVGKWDIKRLQNMGKKLPECYWLLSELKRDYEATEKLIKSER